MDLHNILYNHNYLAKKTLLTEPTKKSFPGMPDSARVLVALCNM